MRVHLPSGLVVDVRTETAQAANDLAAFCPKRDEHVSKLGRRNVPTVHATCGLPVVYVRRRAR